MTRVVLIYLKTVFHLESTTSNRFGVSRERVARAYNDRMWVNLQSIALLVGFTPV